MAQDGRSGLQFTELPILALNHLVHILDPGGRLALRETCSKLREVTDAYGAPTIYLGMDATALSSRYEFLLLSVLSEGVQQLDVACCNADLNAAATEALQQHVAAGNKAWQGLRQLRCHYQQMVLVKALVECKPPHLTTISISGRRGNWQHAGLLLQQLSQLPSLSTLDLALPAQHKLEDYIAQLTQLKSLKLVQAPRSHAPWPLHPLGQNNQAKVDPDFWRHVICALTQLESLQLRLPLTGVGHLDMSHQHQLQRLEVCLGKDSVSELLEEITTLTALTRLAIDGKVGRRLSFTQQQALMNQQHQILDLQSIGQLSALRELQLNLHSVQDVASFIPLSACKQLTQLGCAKLTLQLPWRAADLSPGSVAAADAAEERLLAGVLAGQQDLPVPSVLLARPAGARAAPMNVEGMSDVTFPLLPQLQQIRVMTLAGKLPLPVLAPNVTSLCLQGKERLWSHRKGTGDDMDALFAGMQLMQAEDVQQQMAAAAGAVAAAAAAAANPPQPAAAGAAAAGAPLAVGQQQPPPPPAAPAAANAAPPPPPPPPPGPLHLHGGPIASRARAAVAQAERLLGLKQLAALDVSFTQICGICGAAGGRALLQNVVSLTVLMRGSGRVRNGVPEMPALRRLEFYDDGDLKLPGRFSASYDQKEDHQLWVNQTSLTELVLAGSFMLGGFFDGSALLKARRQFKSLKRWVFKDCLDLSIGHLASLLTIKVAPTIVIEGVTVLTPTEVRTLISLNPNINNTDLVWSAHVPPNIYGPYRDRYGSGYGIGSWWEDEIMAGGPGDPGLEVLIAADGPGAGAAAAAAAGGPAAAAAAGGGVGAGGGDGGNLVAVWPPWLEVGGFDEPPPLIDLVAEEEAAGGGGGAAAAAAAAGGGGGGGGNGEGGQQQQQGGNVAGNAAQQGPAAAAAAAAGGGLGNPPHPAHMGQLQPMFHQAMLQINQAVAAVNQAMAAAGGAAAAAGGLQAFGNPMMQQQQQQPGAQQQQQQQQQQFGPFGGGNVGVIPLAMPPQFQAVAEQMAAAVAAVAGGGGAPGGQPGNLQPWHWHLPPPPNLQQQQQQQQGQQAAAGAAAQPAAAAAAAAGGGGGGGPAGGDVGVQFQVNVGDPGMFMVGEDEGHDLSEDDEDMDFDI